MIESSAAAVYKHRTETNEVRSALEDGVPVAFSAVGAANLSTLSSSRRPHTSTHVTDSAAVASRHRTVPCDLSPRHELPATTDHTPPSMRFVVARVEC